MFFQIWCTGRFKNYVFLREYAQHVGGSNYAIVLDKQGGKEYILLMSGI